MSVLAVVEFAGCLKNPEGLMDEVLKSREFGCHVYLFV